MVIGVLQFELLIPHSGSLKDKRRVVKSLKDRLHREHMASVAEVSGLDEHRRAVLAAAVVSNSPPHASTVLDRIVEKLRGLHSGRVGALTRRIIHESELEDDSEEDSFDGWAEEERRMAAEAERLLDEEHGR